MSTWRVKMADLGTIIHAARWAAAHGGGKPFN